MKELNEAKNNKTRETLQKELEEIKQQWNYVVHFPQDTRYISLFPLTAYTNEKVLEKQEQILKLISEKVATGELEDASTTINQMGSESKERKTTRPKLRLAEHAEQAGVEGDSGDESEEQDPPPMDNLDDDFFINSSASTGSLVEEENSKKKKKKPLHKLKRPKFKIQKN